MARSPAPEDWNSPSASTVGRVVSRRELFLWVAAILAASCFFRSEAYPAVDAFDALVRALTSWNVLHYLGWYALFQLLADSEPSEPASPRDILLCLFATLLPFSPLRSAPWLAATLVAVYIFATSASGSKFRAAAFVLLALAINGLWAPQFFNFFALFVLRIDAAIVAATLSLTQPDIAWHDTIIASARHSIVIYGPCSSFHNLSASLLCWVALSRLVWSDWAWRDAWAGLLICATVVAFNTVRLYCMALSPEQYAYWHAGFGARLFAWGLPIAVIAIASWVALRSLRRT